MDFIEFKKQFKNDQIISHHDIRLVCPDFDDTQLHRWQKKNLLRKITKGYYIFADTEINDQLKFQISNTIYHPSYISLESCLNLYGIIPELVVSPTAVSTRRSYQINSFLGSFIYRTIKEDLFFGYQTERFKNYQYKIADLEKSLLDFLYLNRDIKNLNKAKEYRLDLDFFLEEYDTEKFRQYLSRFQNKPLERRIKDLLGLSNNV